MKMPFNKPYLTGNEIGYIARVVMGGHLSGNGEYTKKCHSFFESRYGFRKCLLTTSGTDALEMASLLLDLQKGDEVIVPSYTFVSTANAFVLRGAKIVFADSMADHPNVNFEELERLITPRTKAIVAVHYAGDACNMNYIMAIANRYGLFVVEDAAQAIDGFYEDRPLGSIGHLSAFSFHETKNIISGEGGMLVVNDERFIRRAEIIWEKGTNRSAFLRGEVDKYSWVDVGSSFLPSELTAAFLYAQLENINDIQARRKAIWNKYYEGLQPLASSGCLLLPRVPAYSTNNAHCFYVVCNSFRDRDGLIASLKEQGVHAVFHYLSLHNSPYYSRLHDGRELPNSERFTNCLVRLPLFPQLSLTDVEYVVDAVINFYENRSHHTSVTMDAF